MVCPKKKIKNLIFTPIFLKIYNFDPPNYFFQFGTQNLKAGSAPKNK
jgi:hypothetical protein